MLLFAQKLVQLGDPCTVIWMSLVAQQTTEMIMILQMITTLVLGCFVPSQLILFCFMNCILLVEL